MQIPKKSRQCKTDEKAHIKLPDERDILCGKGRAVSNHEGSRRFRKIIKSYCGRYQMSPSKQGKMKITKEILEIVNRSGSRFLKYDVKTMSWQQITEIEARDKISHALRFANKVQSQKQQQQKCEGKNKICFLSTLDLFHVACETSTQKKRKGDSLLMESSPLCSLSLTVGASPQLKTLKRPHHSKSFCHLSGHVQYPIDDNTKCTASSQSYDPLPLGMEGKKLQQEESLFLDPLPIALDEDISCAGNDGYGYNNNTCFPQQNDSICRKHEYHNTPLPMLRAEVEHNVSQLAAELDDECIQIMSAFL